MARRARSAPHVSFRAKIVLRCAALETNGEVARVLHTSNATVGKWRERFVEHRVDGLHDEPRPGAPRLIGDDKIEEVVTKTLETRLLPVPAGRWPFPTLSPQSVYRRLDPYPAAPLRCFSRFFPKGFGLASDVTSSARQNITSQCNFNDAALLGAAVIPLCSGSHTCSTPRLHPPLRIHLAGRPGLLRHAMPIWLPNMSRGIATCLNRAIGTAGLPPAGLRPCRLLPTSGSIQTSSTRD